MCQLAVCRLPVFGSFLLSSGLYYQMKGKMKITQPIAGLLLLAFGWVHPACAQQVGWVRYPVAYDLQKVGYPPVAFAPVADGRFYYIEYWPEGPGKATSDYYLQSVKPQYVQGAEEYTEAWAVPIRVANDPKMEPIRVIAGGQQLAVVGRTAVKDPATSIQFFNLSGQLMGRQQYLSPARKNLGDYADYLYTDAKKQYLAWLGYEPGASAKSRSYHASVFSLEGRRLWTEELNVPHTLGRRGVCDAAVDGNGNLYLALVDESPTGTVADTAYGPIVLRYDWKTRGWTQHRLALPGHYCHTVQLETNELGQLMATALLGEADKGLPMRLNENGKLLYWSQLGYVQLNMATQLLLETARLEAPLPDEFAKRYAAETAEGARFGDFRTHYTGDQLLLMMEQQYDKPKPTGRVYVRKDVAALSLQANSSKLNWASAVAKNQTDYSSGRIGYTPALTNLFLHLAYMSDVGGTGKLMLSSINLETGEHLDKELLDNSSGNLFFFTQRSAQTATDRLLLLGLGSPGRNEYTLTHIKSLP